MVVNHCTVRLRKVSDFFGSNEKKKMTQPGLASIII
jgi:hypothetical protein